MAASTGIFNGTDFNVYLFDTTDKPIAHATSAEISFSHSPREATTKDSGGDTDRLPGKRDWSVSVEALHANTETGKQGFAEIFSALKNGTALTVTFTNQNAGDKEYTGTVYVTDCSLNAGVEENMTMSASFSGSGPITEATIS